tara:strand:- start:6599 stop:6736 length:138 start_codon:yes stop_codon:yes gene_type:complete
MFKNKKGIFAMMHPGLMFAIGVVLGLILGFILTAKGILPASLLPF